MTISSLSKIYAIREAAASLLNDEPINEAYHEKDREAKEEIHTHASHHNEMINRHRAISSGTTKTKDLTKHDLAMIAHDYALKHFNNLSANHFNALPEDYHDDRDFYDKLNNFVSKRANTKSKDCGVDCNTSK